MTTRELSAPPVEPVGVAEAKSHLLVDHDGDDVLIAALIRAARQHVERETRRALVIRPFRRYLDAWPERRVVDLAPSPLHRVVEVRIYDAEGAPEVLDGALWLADLGAEPGRLMLRRGVMALPGRPLSGRADCAERARCLSGQWPKEHTMNRYPWWKYLILGLALLVGLVYTLPNFYGEAPAV